ncbi:MAG: sterol desaturase family protein [Chitinophagaceae bacterium]
MNNKHIGLLQLVNLSTFIHVVIGFLLIDIFIYWWHCINYEWRFLWYFHKFRHEDEKLNSTSALRFHTQQANVEYATKLNYMFLF